MCTMDAPTPPADEQPGDGRSETPAERLDRNWNEILQELRVTQTGIQILTGFLLTVPFQQRFTELTDDQRRIYLTLVVLAAVTTGLLVAPVSMHRWLFRRGAKSALVIEADRLMRVGLVFLAVVVSGVVLLVFDVVTTRPVAPRTGRWGDRRVADARSARRPPASDQRAIASLSALVRAASPNVSYASSKCCSANRWVTNSPTGSLPCATSFSSMPRVSVLTRPIVIATLAIQRSWIGSSTGWPCTPTFATRPPGRTMSRHILKVAGMPTASTATSTP